MFEKEDTFYYISLAIITVIFGYIIYITYNFQNNTFENFSNKKKDKSEKILNDLNDSIKTLKDEIEDFPIKEFLEKYKEKFTKETFKNIIESINNNKEAGVKEAFNLYKTTFEGMTLLEENI